MFGTLDAKQQGPGVWQSLQAWVERGWRTAVLAGSRSKAGGDRPRLDGSRLATAPAGSGQISRGYLLNVYVEPEHRRKKLARQLIDQALAEARRQKIRVVALIDGCRQAALREKRLPPTNEISTGRWTLNRHQQDARSFLHTAGLCGFSLFSRPRHGTRMAPGHATRSSKQFLLAGPADSVQQLARFCAVPRVIPFMSRPQAGNQPHGGVDCRACLARGTGKEGGDNRQESVTALKALPAADDDNHPLHDAGVRPLIDPATIERTIER